MSKLAVVRIKGISRLPSEVVDTLKMLNLEKKFACAVVDNNKSFKGMVKKVDHMVAWGEVSEETIKLLEKRKRGKGFALHPPIGGFGRKGIKLPFGLGGAYGYRAEKINDLLKRMV